MAGIRPTSGLTSGLGMEGLRSMSAETPQRKLLDFMLRLMPFVEVMGSRSPNYKRGQKYCPNCRIAFYANLERCPYCGYLLRSSPKGGRRRRERRYIDPEKYGVMVEA